jgi:Tfp pilus assembly protein PilN
MSITQRVGSMFGQADGGGSTSFLPSDYLTQKAETRANVVCLVLFGVVLFGVVGAFLVTHRAWNTVRDQQRRINAEYTEQTKKIEQLKQLDAQQGLMLEKAEVAATLNERVPRSILMAEVVNRMPERLTLTEMQLSSKRIIEAPPKSATGPQSLGKTMPKGAKPSVPGQGAKGAAGTTEESRPKPPRMEFNLTLMGLASNDEGVADFQRGLKECALLDRVDLVSAEAVTIDEVTMRKFRIEAMIRDDADARRIEPLQVPRLKSAMKGKPGSGNKQVEATEPEVNPGQ